jgi:hypothetical protein
MDKKMDAPQEPIELTTVRAERDRFKRMYEELIAMDLEELLKLRKAHRRGKL